MDRETLIKFKPVLNSPIWERFEDDVLIPKLAEFRLELEIGGPKDDRNRGKIEFINYLLRLKKDSRNVEVN